MADILTDRLRIEKNQNRQTWPPRLPRPRQTHHDSVGTQVIVGTNLHMVLDSVGGAESYKVSVSWVGSPAKQHVPSSDPAPQSQKNLKIQYIHIYL